MRLRSLALPVSLFALILSAACGGKVVFDGLPGSSTGGAGGTGGSTSITTSTNGPGSSTVVGSSTSGMGGSNAVSATVGVSSSVSSTGSGPVCMKGPQCAPCCAQQNPQAAAAFFVDELKECACANPGAPCEMQCAKECVDPSALMPNTPCGNCLGMQFIQGTNSACTVKAALTDCANDPSCSPFINCFIGNCT